MRRFAIAFVALAVTAIAFHGALALGLVARGDDVLQGGSPTGALVYYDRAALLAPRDPIVADRTAFAALLGRRPAAERAALDRVRASLAADRRNVALRFDNARLAHAIGAERESCDAYRELGATTADWRYSEFAAQCARKLGRIADAKRAFARVLALMPGNGVARRELALLQRRP